MSEIAIPELSLVVLMGASGSGKSTFARRAFKATEVISSDYCRGLVSDDESDQSATADAFDVLHYIAAKRLTAGKLTVVDATSVHPHARKPLVQLAREHDCPAVAIVLNVPEEVCLERNRVRPDRQIGARVVHQQHRALARTLNRLPREGFRYVTVLTSPEEVDAAFIAREPSWTKRLDEHGPFDVIGDVHGCCDELEQLLARLGYGCEDGVYRHPEHRKAVFLGDIVDRGPRVLDSVRLVKAMVEAGSALCVPGNHDRKLVRKLRGRDVQVSHGLEVSLAEIAALPEGERAAAKAEIAAFFEPLVSHYVLDGGNLVVAHGGMPERYQGRASNRVRSFALYGETTGETDEYGLPVRYNWAADYRGKAMVVYGHTPVLTPEWLNNTINVDTGCVFGGSLTALRYPERELVSVPAARVYYEPARPLGAPAPAAASAQHDYDDVLDVADVLGRRLIGTRLQGNLTIPEENAAGALEVMSRFAVDPKWLIYLPPTMAPPESATEPGYLEYPSEAFAYFGGQGVREVVCEEKHMGSRAIIVVCRDADAARRRFGVAGDAIGCCFTRTGRPFFDRQPELQAELLARVRTAVDRAGLWDELGTDWLCLDCEAMPWSLKAQELLREQYAPVGAAATVGLEAAVQVLEDAAVLTDSLVEVLGRFRLRQQQARRYVDAYGRYCWPVQGLDGVRLAPFHLLAGETGVYLDRDHVWHMETLARLAAVDPLFVATPYRLVDLEDAGSVSDATAWWREVTDGGGEGMVVKPRQFVEQGKRGLVQPAVKCRGAEYLRIIYGPEYDAPENLSRLRSRQVGGKRSLALREFALGIEALERFVRREPLRRVHECVFGVLALESEPIDPRL